MGIFDEKLSWGSKSTLRNLWKNLYGSIHKFPNRTYKHLIETRLIWKLRKELNENI